MKMQKPHEIITDAEDVKRLRELGDLLMPLTSEEAAHLEPKTASERGAWLQERLDSIRDHGKAKTLEEAPGARQAETP